MLSLLPNALQHRATDHVAVLADEVRDLLAVRPGETVVDATFGAGGHATLLAADLAGRGRLIAIDRDPDARAYFDRVADRVRVPTRFLRGAFDVVLAQLGQNGVRADAILFDLGVSSMQIDRLGAGLLVRRTTLRSTCAWIPRSPTAAREIVNEESERELADVFRRYGEERFARQIAREIVRRRRRRTLERARESSSTRSAPRYRLRGASATGTRRSGCSRRCGLR